MAKPVLKIKKPLNGYSKVINKLKIDEYQFDSLISLAIPLNSEKKCVLNFKKSLGEPMPNIEKSIINKILLKQIQDVRVVQSLDSEPPASRIACSIRVVHFILV